MFAPDSIAFAWLLLALHVLLFAGMMLTALLAGFALYPPRPATRFADIAFQLLTAYGLGLCLLSAMIAWLGLIGILKPWPAAVSALGLCALGAARGLKIAILNLGQFPSRTSALWRNISPLERGLAGLAGLWMLALCLNIFVGSLAPDNGQDTLWYHLTVPGQWALRGNLQTFPLVMPANYPLACEALYAGLLLFFDEIACSMLNAQITLALLSGLVILAARFVDRRGALYTALIAVALVANGRATAPVGAGNDNFAALLLMLGFALFLKLLTDEKPAGRFTILAMTGFLLGTALATKLVTLPYVTLMCCGYGLTALWPGGERTRKRVAADIALAVTAMGLAFLPWAIRGWLGSGNPIFPLGAGLFPLRDSHAPLMALSGKLNGLYPLTAAGLTEALRDGLPHKLYIAMTGGDVMFWIPAIAGIWALCIPGRIWKFQGLCLLCAYAAFVLMRGHNEVARYFSLCYPMAAVAFAGLLRWISRRLRPALFLFLLIVIACGAAGSFIKGQLTVARFPTIRWGYRPVLTAAARLDYARHTEYGPLYVAARALQPCLPRDATVFLPDCSHPFYIKRRAYWADELCRDAASRRWAAMTPEAMTAMLAAQGCNKIVLLNKDTRGAYEELAARGLVKAEPRLPAPLDHIRIYSVTTARRTPG